MSNFRIYNSELCPKIWDANDTLHHDVRVSLLKLANDFYKKTNFVAPIIDIYLMGSIASYNWTPDSDIDVHVIINFKQLQMPEETANKVVKSMGAIWNKEHNVIINGHKVELNIQSYEEKKPHVEGIYSLISNRWIRKPQLKTLLVNKPIIIGEYKKMAYYLSKAIQSDSREYVSSVKDYLDDYRQHGLDHGGELSIPNIVFKILRAKGYIKQLKDKLVQLYDKENSFGNTPEYKNINVNENYNFDSDIDKEYLKAAEDASRSKDYTLVQKMVDYAAKNAGYTTEVYKGYYPYDCKSNKPITTISRQTEHPAFNDGETGVKIAGFFAKDKAVAEKFKFSKGTVNKFFLMVNSPFVIDAKNSFAGHIQFGKTGIPFREAIRSGRYDSIVINNTRDEGDIIVSLDSKKIKLASAIVYDDKGNIIPLSKRFDDTNKDMRFEQKVK